jgi:hypothetical protein
LFGGANGVTSQQEPSALNPNTATPTHCWRYWYRAAVWLLPGWVKDTLHQHAGDKRYWDVVHTNQSR